MRNLNSQRQYTKQCKHKKHCYHHILQCILLIHIDSSKPTSHPVFNFCILHSWEYYLFIVSNSLVYFFVIDITYTFTVSSIFNYSCAYPYYFNVTFYYFPTIYYFRWLCLWFHAWCQLLFWWYFWHWILHKNP